MPRLTGSVSVSKTLQLGVKFDRLQVPLGGGLWRDEEPAAEVGSAACAAGSK